MTNQRYRNVYLDNHSHFCTASVVARLTLLADDKARMQVINSWSRQRARYSVLIEGFVIMPDHVHLLVRGLADGVRKFMQYSLAETSRDIRMALQLGARTGDAYAQSQLDVITARANGGSTGKVWKERFRCIPLDREDAVLQKLEYMHRNPLKAELVTALDAWPWCSYSHYAGKGCVLRVDDLQCCGNSTQ